MCGFVYVDGVLLLNLFGLSYVYLLCWLLILFDDIVCVDVFYGFFFVLYLGNLIGLIVLFIMCCLE